jgi:hypothetical protein
MTRVVADDMLRTKLCDLTQPVEICDNAGRVLGHFMPGAVDLYDKTGNVLGCFLAYEGREPQISSEELQRRRQNKGKTYTTAEVLAHLEKL